MADNISVPDGYITGVDTDAIAWPLPITIRSALTTILPALTKSTLSISSSPASCHSTSVLMLMQLPSIYDEDDVLLTIDLLGGSQSLLKVEAIGAPIALLVVRLVPILFFTALHLHRYRHNCVRCCLDWIDDRWNLMTQSDGGGQWHPRQSMLHYKSLTSWRARTDWWWTLPFMV